MISILSGLNDRGNALITKIPFAVGLHARWNKFYESYDKLQYLLQMKQCMWSKAQRSKHPQTLTHCMKWNLHLLSKIRNWFQEVDFIRYLSTCIMFSQRQFIGCTSTFPANCNGHFQLVGIEHKFRNCWNGTFPGKIMNLNDRWDSYSVWFPQLSSRPG